MKVAVSSTGNDLSAAVDQRFGRCRCFLIVDTKSLDFAVIENTNANLSGSAGIQSAGLIADQGAAAVITGNCGPKAMDVFNRMKIPVITGITGTVGDAVAKYSRGDLAPAAGASVAEKSGVQSRSQTAGMGRGMGMGMGGGRGMGGCGGRGRGRRCQQPFPGGSSAIDSPSEKLVRLQEQADALQRQMADIQARITKLS